MIAAGGAGIAAPVLTGTAHAAPAHSAAKTQAHERSSAQAPAHAPARSEARDAYTVVDGDTLHLIADRNDVEGGWSAVYAANRDTIGADPHTIVPGQRLTLATGGATASADQAGAMETGTGADGVRRTQSTDLDGWINEALEVMAREGIPGSYEGIHRNILRESGGDPDATNNWDSNARNGTPSIGLLQIIKPTFDAYHVDGTAFDQRDPVANIVAACNYAAQTYGSIDNVDGPY
ncbi:transglycosylase SLT domain-containing protein [Streptomyces sp. NPDC054784]